jgi:hypothetical protein
MTEGLSSSHTRHKRVPIQERSFTTGDLTGINGYHANRTLLKQRFSEGGYHLQETPHFLLCTRTAAPSTILVHWLAPAEIDASENASLTQAAPSDFSPYSSLSPSRTLTRWLALILRPDLSLSCVPLPKSNN